MTFKRKELDEDFINQLKTYVHDIIGYLFTVYKSLPCGYPEYIYQEVLEKVLLKNNVAYRKEAIIHPTFEGQELETYLKADFAVERPGGNIIIECKAVEDLGDKERHQLFSYLIGSQYPIGILVNFSTYPKAQIEKYYFDEKDNTITAF